jgi:3-deoxy-D-manno-octulosonate 8-phosphate phosphatase KdsC-like HAD superfamily phosphatase
MKMTLTESRKIKFLFEESNGVLTEGIMDNIKNSIKKRFSRKDTEEIKQSLSDNLGIDENS